MNFFCPQEEKQKAYRRDKRKDRKRKAQGDIDEGDPDMAAVMGFSGFGTTKK
jgi:U4/U6.U5 tri-snRNP component SNU23